MAEEKISIKNIMDDVDKKFTFFLASGKYKEYLKFAGNLGKYSYNNQSYLFCQAIYKYLSKNYPDYKNLTETEKVNAVNVAIDNVDIKTMFGIAGWNARKRNINKGEKGYKVFAPIIAKDHNPYCLYVNKENVVFCASKQLAEQEDVKRAIFDINKNKFNNKAEGYSAINKFYKDNHHLIDKQSPELNGFTIQYVWDIAQTNGAPIPDFKIDDKVVVQNYDTIVKALDNFISSKGYKLYFDDLLGQSKDCGGYCSYDKKEIHVRNVEGQLSRLSVLIHETGHMVAHEVEYKKLKQIINEKEKEGRPAMFLTDDDVKKYELKPRNIKEVEAESIACVVCSYLGFADQVQESNFNYIAGWSSQDIMKFRNNMDYISANAKTIINVIDKELERVREEQTKQKEEFVPDLNRGGRERSR